MGLYSWHFDFNKNHLAPPRTKVMFHSKLDKRASWVYHGLATDHYWCLQIYIPTTRSEVVSDTIKFIPRFIPFSEANIDDHLRKTANNLVHLLLNRTPLISALQPKYSREVLL